MKSFEELIDSVNDVSIVDLTPAGPDKNGVEITNYEIETRINCLLNGYRMAENWCREEINNISFELNRKALEGCQIKELIELYNQKIGCFLDAFLY